MLICALLLYRQETERNYMTLQELSKYNGLDDTKIYIGCNGKVYDVTNSEFYKPGQGYGVFAGSDATVGLAKMNLSPEWLNQTGYAVLKQKEIEVLKGWQQKFEEKYKIVGYLKGVVY